MLGLGAIYRECTVCDGVGYIEVDAALSKPEEVKLVEVVEDVSPADEVRVTKPHVINKRSKEYRESKKLAGE